MKNTLSMECEPTSQNNRGIGFSVDAALTGEARLLAAILISAIEDLRMDTGKNKRTASAWLDSKNDGTFSFLGICEFFNLDPEKVRKLMRCSLR